VSGETEQQVSGWTTDTLKSHQSVVSDLRFRIFEEKIARVDERLNAEERFQSERDRRYTEVAVEREKALTIKEEEKKAALALAREIQTYKDEKANELREQISRERGLYVTQQELKGVSDKIDATMKPVIEYVSSQQGRTTGRLSQQQFAIMVTGLGISAVLAFITVASVIVAIAYAIRK